MLEASQAGARARGWCPFPPGGVKAARLNLLAFPLLSSRSSNGKVELPDEVYRWGEEEGGERAAFQTELPSDLGG